jgi:Na+/melibiose symporter-like transporter
VEYGEWKTGVRGEGTVSSSLTFINKFGNALGGMLLGFVLSAAGYVAGQEQTPLVLSALHHIQVTVPIIVYVISIIAMSFYPITNEFFAKMTQELQEKRAAAQAETLNK